MTTVPPNRAGRRLLAEAAALRELRTRLTVSVSTGADALGTGRDRMRLAVERGDIPSIKIAGERRIASVVLLGLLGLGPEPVKDPIHEPEDAGP